jgi:hypothetical protein
VATLLVVATVWNTGAQQQPVAAQKMSMTMDAEMEGSSKSRDCTFDECYGSACNAKVAPYTCLFHNGGPHGGCSPTPWISFTCDDACDLSKCDTLDIPDSTKGCTEACTKEWCKGEQICPSDVPYQCVDGSARFGCSTDDLTWTLRTDSATCSECCDASQC